MNKIHIVYFPYLPFGTQKECAILSLSIVQITHLNWNTRSLSTETI